MDDQTLNETVQKKISEISRRITPILRKGGVTEASIFGSYIRGETTHQSDIDLLVEYEEAVSLFDVGGLKHDLELELGCKVDLISARYLKPRIQKHIMRDRIRIL